MIDLYYCANRGTWHVGTCDSMDHASSMAHLDAKGMGIKPGVTWYYIAIEGDVPEIIEVTV